MDSEEVRSLEALYKQYSGAVFGYLLHLSGNHTLADELTAETFYRAIRAVDGFRGEASVKTWLIRIARNLYLRRMEREKRLISLEEVQERGVTFVSSSSDPETAVISQEKSRIIQKALLALREEDRSILLLSAQEKMRCREIAEVLDISVSAVKVRLHRARRRLAAVLAEEREE